MARRSAPLTWRRVPGRNLRSGEEGKSGLPPSPSGDEDSHAPGGVGGWGSTATLDVWRCTLHHFAQRLRCRALRHSSLALPLTEEW